jgi:hypothetical protein
MNEPTDDDKVHQIIDSKIRRKHFGGVHTSLDGHIWIVVYVVGVHLGFFRGGFQSVCGLALGTGTALGRLGSTKTGR